MPWILNCVLMAHISYAISILQNGAHDLELCFFKILNSTQLGRSITKTFAANKTLLYSNLFIEACLRQDLVTANTLLKAGADINFFGSGLGTALHEAAAMGIADLVEFLMQKGADPGLQNIDGNTPLHLATICRNKPVIKLLITDQINTYGKFGATALHFAIGAPRIIKQLLKHGAQIDYLSTTGDSPLHVATYNGDSPSLEILFCFATYFPDTHTSLKKVSFENKLNKIHPLSLKKICSNYIAKNTQILEKETPQLPNEVLSKLCETLIKISCLQQQRDLISTNELFRFFLLRAYGQEHLNRFKATFLVKNDKGLTPFDYAQLNDRQKTIEFIEQIFDTTYFENLNKTYQYILIKNYEKKLGL